MYRTVMAVAIFLLSNNVLAQFDARILDKIRYRARETHSDAVIIKQNGKVIYEEYSGEQEKPIYIASAGKSLTSLAIVKLMDDGLLDSLNQPVHTLFPEWKQGMKKDITIGMLLNHTSGLQNHPNASIEIEPPPDHKVDNIIKLALAAELSQKPGTDISYNNKAVALLAGIVEKASGMPMDRYFVKEFYDPLEVTGFSWVRDRAGNPTAHGAFVIKPTDFIKFGELMLNGGTFNDKRLLSQKWIDRSLEQSQKFTPIWGLLWWRLPTFEKRLIDDDIWDSWSKNNVSESFMEKMKPLKGKVFETKFDFFEALRNALGDSWNQQLIMEMGTLESCKRIYSDSIVAYYADGFRGNYLVFVPDRKIVAVRCADHEGFDYQTDSFTDFVHLVSKL